MSRVTTYLPGALGVALFCALWEAIGTFRLAGMTWPALSTVLHFAGTPANQPLLLRAATASFLAVAKGYAVGLIIGLALAAQVRLLRPCRAGIDRLVVLVHATPGIALAPVFMIFLDRDQIPVAIAAMSVFYLIYVATTSGLETATRSHRDLFGAFGASHAQIFFRLELPAALPALASGLKLAVPVAFMGAIIGEWFGASRGLGLLMISAMQNFQIPLLWTAVLLTILPTLLLYLLMSLTEQTIHGKFA
jgi:ABC-type nitrate/sulfonate/bicarbonate transport system permease component